MAVLFLRSGLCHAVRFAFAFLVRLLMNMRVFLINSQLFAYITSTLILESVSTQAVLLKYSLVYLISVWRMKYHVH